MSLHKTLKAFADENHLLGETADQTSLKDDQVIQLKSELLKISQKNRVFFWMTIGMVMLLFVISLFVILRFMDDPKQIKLIFGATGISVMGLIAYANKLWKDIVRTDMTITLMTAMDKKGINTMLLILIKKL